MQTGSEALQGSNVQALGWAEIAGASIVTGFGGFLLDEGGIATAYGTEVQSLAPEALDAPSGVQNGATVYRTGALGENMAAESQYWSLENPLTNANYGNSMGMPAGGTPNFVMGGSLNPGASVVTNAAPGLGANVGGGIQVVTSSGGVGNIWFIMT